MKPVKYVAIHSNSVKEFEKNFNQALKDGLTPFGDTQFIEGEMFQGMVKLLPIVQAPVPQVKEK